MTAVSIFHLNFSVRLEISEETKSFFSRLNTFIVGRCNNKVKHCLFRDKYYYIIHLCTACEIDI